jgi:peroxiredoxin
MTERAPTTTATAASLRSLLAELHATRVATWPADDLAANVDQRRLLEETADRSAFVRPGDVLDPFTLVEVQAGPVTLDGLLAGGPLVLIFFRFAGCPACNLALPYYQRELLPGLDELGATLVAVSPQVPEDLVEIKTRHDLGFAVASDHDDALARRLGIAYTPDAASRAYAERKGSDIGAITGTGRWELPMPTVLVVDRQRVVRFADVHPDWLVRTEAPEILAAVRALSD